jgi:DNA polymerase (family 10)
LGIPLADDRARALEVGVQPRAVITASLPRTLHLLADVARIRGRHAEAAAYARVADRLASGSPGQTSDDESALVRDALAAIREQGAQAAVARAVEDVPQDLRRLVEQRILSPAEAARVVAEAGAITAGDLIEALRAGELGWMEPERRDAFASQVARVRAERAEVPLGRTWTILEPLISSIRGACPEVQQVAPTGRARRYDALVGAVGLLVCTPDPARTAARLIGLAPDMEPLHAGPLTVVFRLERADVTIRLVSPDRWGHALVWFTGSSPHLARLSRWADAHGLSFGREGLRAAGRPIPTPRETDLYAALGLPLIPPEMRESGDEIDAAAAGTLPEPVSLDEIRGDLHMHSDWSDGRSSMDAMVSAAEALGYEYVAITDHSVSSGIARGLDTARLDRQREAVAALRERHPRITILHGAEVDILQDGSLDYGDPVLESLDVVLASLHDPADHDGTRLTSRYEAAMRHPLVQIVTHPTNRFVPSRPGYDLDEGRLFEAAVETGTILEIDGAPSHLDMDGAMARRAVAAGVDVSIDGDCHRAEWLGRQMLFGVATARRGWVTADRVVNARPLAALRERLTRKRRAR